MWPLQHDLFFPHSSSAAMLPRMPCSAWRVRDTGYTFYHPFLLPSAAGPGCLEIFDHPTKVVLILKSDAVQAALANGKFCFASPRADIRELTFSVCLPRSTEFTLIFDSFLIAQAALRFNMDTTGIQWELNKASTALLSVTATRLESVATLVIHLKESQQVPYIQATSWQFCMARSEISVQRVISSWRDFAFGIMLLQKRHLLARRPLLHQASSHLVETHGDHHA